MFLGGIGLIGGFAVAKKLLDLVNTAGKAARQGPPTAGTFWSPETGKTEEKGDDWVYHPPPPT